MLKEALEGLEPCAQLGENCRLFDVANEMDRETREVLIKTCINPSISTTSLHKALRSEGIRIDRTGLGNQRKCMVSKECKCDWDSIS